MNYRWRGAQMAAYNYYGGAAIKRRVIFYCSLFFYENPYL